MYIFNLSFLRLPQTHNALQLPVLLDFIPALSGILGNSEQTIILQTIKQLIQFTVLEIQFWSLKYMVVIRMRNNLSNFPFLSKQYKAITVC